MRWSSDGPCGRCWFRICRHHPQTPWGGCSAVSSPDLRLSCELDTKALKCLKLLKHTSASKTETAQWLLLNKYLLKKFILFRFWSQCEIYFHNWKWIPMQLHLLPINVNLYSKFYLEEFTHIWSRLWEWYSFHFVIPNHRAGRTQCQWAKDHFVWLVFFLQTQSCPAILSNDFLIHYFYYKRRKEVITFL